MVLQKRLFPFAKTHPVTNDYDLSQQLGVGKFSIVKVGTSKVPPAGTRVAVKCINKQGCPAPLLLKEVEIMRLIGDHPGVIKLYDVYEDSTMVYLILELVTGGELFDKIVTTDVYSEKIAASYIRQVVEVVAYLHDKRIVHRDLKPENLLLEDATAQRLKVCDFGLAEILEPVDAPLYMVVGSPNYMAPEVQSGVGYHTPVDMYSIGVILYTLLCGYLPIEPDAGVTVLEFPSPDWDGISDQVKELIELLLDETPSKRPTARQMLRHPWVCGENVSEKVLVGTIRNLGKFTLAKKEHAQKGNVFNLFGLNQTGPAPSSRGSSAAIKSPGAAAKVGGSAAIKSPASSKQAIVPAHKVAENPPLKTPDDRRDSENKDKNKDRSKDKDKDRNRDKDKQKDKEKLKDKERSKDKDKQKDKSTKDSRSSDKSKPRDASAKSSDSANSAATTELSLSDLDKFEESVRLTETNLKQSTSSSRHSSSRHSSRHSSDRRSSVGDRDSGETTSMRSAGNSGTSAEVPSSYSALKADDKSRRRSSSRRDAPSRSRDDAKYDGSTTKLREGGRDSGKEGSSKHSSGRSSRDSHSSRRHSERRSDRPHRADRSEDARRFVVESSTSSTSPYSSPHTTLDDLLGAEKVVSKVQPSLSTLADPNAVSPKSPIKSPSSDSKRSSERRPSKRTEENKSKEKDRPKRERHGDGDKKARSPDPPRSEKELLSPPGRTRSATIATSPTRSDDRPGPRYE